MDPRYKAFISYSHADTAWGEWLHRALEGYRLPGAFVGLRNEGGGRIEPRFGKVFRDRDELTSGADLAAAIRVALAASENLVVICSPASARSVYVQQEIVEFKRLGRADRVHALIVGGEPHASALPGRADEECLPRALRFALDARGELSDTPGPEVLAPDARPGRDGRERALIKLIAGLLQVDFDALYQRERRRRRQRWLAAGAGTLAVVSALAGLGVYARQRDAEAAHQQAVADHAAYATALELAEASRREREPARAVAALRAQIPADGAPDRREFAWRHLWSLYDGHRHAVFVAGQPTTLDLSPDGRTLAIANGSSLVTFWDTARGTETGRLEDTAQRVQSARFAADGRALVLEAEPQRTGELRVQLRDPLPPAAERDGLDGKALHLLGLARQRVLVLTREGLRLVDAGGGPPAALQPEPDLQGDLRVASSRDGTWLALAGNDGAIWVYDAASGRLRHRHAPATAFRLSELLFAHDGSLLRVGETDDGRHAVGVLAAGADGERLRLHGDSARDSPVRALSLSHDGRLLALLSGTPGISPAQASRVTVWGLDDGRQRYTLDEAATGYATAIAFSPTADRLAIGGRDHHLRLWEASSGRLLGVRGVHHGEATRAHDAQREHRETGTLMRESSRLEAGLSTLLYSRDGRTLVSASDELGSVRLWDPEMPPQQLDHPEPASHQLALAFAADGQALATGDRSGEVTLWAAADGRRLAQARAGGAPVQQLAFSPDGRTLAAAGADGVVRLLRRSDLGEQRRLPVPLGTMLQLALADGHVALLQRVRPGRDEQLEARFWPLPGDGGRPKAHGLGSGPAALSPDGRWVASLEAPAGAARRCRLRLTALDSGRSTGTELHPRKHCGSLTVFDLVWSPDGRALAIAGPEVGLEPARPDGRFSGVRVFESRDLSERARLALPLAFTTTRGLAGLAFSPDGQRIAAAAVAPDRDERYTTEEPAVALWDLAAPAQRRLVRVPSEGCGGWRGSGCIRWGGFLQDGQGFVLAVGGQRSHDGQPALLRWSGPDAAPQRLALEDRAMRLAMAPGGQRLAFVVPSSTGGEPATLLDTTAALRPVATLGHYAPVITALARAGGGPVRAESVTLPVTGGLATALWDLSAGQAWNRAATPPGDDRRQADLAAHGEVFAQRADDGTVRVGPVGGQTPPVTLAERLAADERPDWAGRTRSAPLRLAPDGRLLATVGAERTRLWDTATGALRHAWPGTAPLAFNEDGRLVALSVGCRSIVVHDTRTGAARAEIPAEGGCPGALALAPDGARLLAIRAVSSQGAALFGVTTARVWPLDSGRPPADLSGYASGDRVLAAWSPDGRTLATSGPRGSVNLWEPLTGRRLLVLAGEGRDDTALAFASDGRSLMLAQRDRVRVWAAP